MALEPSFLAFVALETSSKLDRFSGMPGATPDFRIRTSGMARGLFQEAVEDPFSNFMA
jgi:hypothetical protein